MPKLRNLQGMKFGRLTAIYRDTNAKNGRVRWFCRCECGGTKTAYAKTLLNGDTKSCGCLHTENAMRNVKNNEKPIGYERTKTNGRIEVKTAYGFRFKHDAVVEQFIGRKLLPNECVHHIDGNFLNNDISNLRLMGHGEHTTLHNKERHQRRLECQVA